MRRLGAGRRGFGKLGQEVARHLLKYARGGALGARSPRSASHDRRLRGSPERAALARSGPCLWLLGAHQGAVALDYLDEFTFRFNRRTSVSRGKLFDRLARQAVQVAPTTYDALGKHNP